MFRGPGSDFSTWRGLVAQCDSGVGGFWVFRGPGSDFYTWKGLMAQCDCSVGEFLVFRALEVIFPHGGA